MAFELPKLAYGYDALEPYIDKETMVLHHDKHHQTYIDNLNKALDGHNEYANKSVEDLLRGLDQLPDTIRQAVTNNGGGHANHSFFWEIMTPKSTLAPKGELLEAINKTFSSFEKFSEEFTSKALGVFGSGWAFLVLTPQKELKLKRHSFQNSPISDGNIPLLGIDVWEHAYYLKYQNRRAEYVKAWWNVVNWQKVEQIFKTSF